MNNKSNIIVKEEFIAQNKGHIQNTLDGNIIQKITKLDNQNEKELNEKLQKKLEAAKGQNKLLKKEIEKLKQNLIDEIKKKIEKEKNKAQKKIKKYNEKIMKINQISSNQVWNDDNSGQDQIIQENKLQSFQQISKEGQDQNQKINKRITRSQINHKKVTSQIQQQNILNQKRKAVKGQGQELIQGQGQKYQGYRNSQRQGQVQGQAQGQFKGYVKGNHFQKNTKINWDDKATYENFFQTYSGIEKCRRIFHLHIISFRSTDQILKFYCGKFAFQLSDLLIFNYLDKLSIIVIRCHTFTQCTLKVFKKNLGDKCVISAYRQTKEDLINIQKFCTVEHNRQKLSKFIQSPYMVKGIETEYDKFVMKGTALCFVYNQVKDIKQFLESLQKQCRNLKTIQKKNKTKEVSQEIIISNYNQGEEVLIIVVFDLLKARVFITKDIFQSVNDCYLNQVLVHQGEKPEVERIKQLIQRKLGYDKQKIIWFENTGKLKKETNEEKKQKFEDFFLIQEDNQNKEENEDEEESDDSEINDSQSESENENENENEVQ